MKKTLRSHLASLLCCFVLPVVAGDQPLKLWYTRSATELAKSDSLAGESHDAWLNALPIGNSYMGAMIYGDVAHEHLQLNNKTLWSGSYFDSDNPDAYASQAKIVELLNAGKYKEANELALNTQKCKGKGSGWGQAAKNGAPFGSYQTLGDLKIDFDNQAEYSDYYRELDLNDAVAKVVFRRNGALCTREYFASYPDNVIVVRLTTTDRKGLTFNAGFSRPERFQVSQDGKFLLMKGVLDNAQGGDGMRYALRMGAQLKGGRLMFRDGKMRVEGAREVVLYLTSVTDYRLHYPDYVQPDFKENTKEILTAAMAKSYNALLNAHQRDYSSLFDRVSLELNPSADKAIPTDIRLKNFRKNPNDHQLLSLYFQYGRYLLISSSRPGTLPANLQGVWANTLQTPWNGDYHTNINVQMNYWPAEVTNLSELHAPMFDLIQSLVKPGRKTAEVHYKAKGWCMHPITNVWGFTSPGEGGVWGIHIAAAGWMCSHLWEHYAFTQDKDFLNNYFPVIKESAEFYLDYLKKDPQTGLLVSGPSASPENAFIAPDGSKDAICMAPAHDQEIIWDLFTNYLNAAKELGISDSTTKRVAEAYSHLSGLKIGKDGRLLEWDKEYLETEPGHRHISHLYALHPGKQITEDTPELFSAANKTLEYRLANGGGHTGWSMAWIANFRARLKQGNQALEAVNGLLKKSTVNNLFDMHPPFQIDGNFGATAAIAEMLLQSHNGKIELLPALPDRWKNGKVTGLCARGGLVVDLEWENNSLKKATVHALKDADLKIVYKGETREMSLKKGGSYIWK